MTAESTLESTLLIIFLTAPGKRDGIVSEDIILKWRLL